MKKLFVTLLALISLFSCQKSEYDIIQDFDDSELFATMENLNATRTSMDENNNVLWSEDDQIVAFMKTTFGSKYQIKEQYVGTTTGGFSKIEVSSGDDLESGQEINHNVVLYPYSGEVVCMKNDTESPTRSYKLNVVLPEIQYYAENSFGNGTFPMVAVSTSNQITFRNVCGGVKLQLKGVDKIKSIKLEGLEEELISGKSTVVCYADGNAPSITMNAAEATTTVTLDCTEAGVQLNETTPTTFILAVPPVTFASGMKITITDTDGMSKTFTNRSSNTITRSNLLTFPTVTYKQENSSGNDESAADLSQYTDLSTDGTANCYLVKVAGKYKFKAVKGNSTTSAGEVSKAEVLWESFGTDATPQEGDLVTAAGYKDGYVYFSTPETFANGNASIAVKDANGTILWSWHIWCSKEGWTDQVYANNAGTMMDRNLGATSATPGNVGALGLLYQWGRKDPFLGSSSINSSLAFASSTGNWTKVYEAQTVDYSVANPLVFICEFEWCSGEGSYDSDYSKRWMDTEKTMYDPCPVGYRVPEGGEDGIWNASKVRTEWNTTNKGMYWQLANGSDAWYPAAGYYMGNPDGGGWIEGVGSWGLCWSATPFPGSYDIVYSFSFGYDGNVSPAFYFMNRVTGNSVRCLRESN
ncbi:MAG: hypothetical protein IKY70_00805 [Bacteroidales bacterium]|nr:hypothetical protein [Bacteroidales bacterium]